MQQAEFRVRDGYGRGLPYGRGARGGVRDRALRRHGSPRRAGRRPGQLPASRGCPLRVRVRGRRTGGERAVVRFKNGSADEADVVVGADGIRSAVRASLLGPEEPRCAGYTCWRGSARGRRRWPRATSASGGAAGGGSGSPLCRATASTGGQRRTSRSAGWPGMSAGTSPRRSADGPTRSRANRHHPPGPSAPQRYRGPPADLQVGVRPGLADRGRGPSDHPKPRAGRVHGHRRRRGGWPAACGGTGTWRATWRLRCRASPRTRPSRGNRGGSGVSGSGEAGCRVGCGIGCSGCCCRWSSRGAC